MDAREFPVVGLSTLERATVEQLVGHSLADGQIVRIEISPPAELTLPAVSSDDELPDWCQIYAGMTDEEIDRLEATILAHRFDLRQPAD